MLVSLAGDGGSVDTSLMAAVLMFGMSADDPTAWSLGCYVPATGGEPSFVSSPYYTSVADLQAALTNFLTIVGAPWVAVGEPSNYPDVYGNAKVPVAVNPSLVQNLTDSGSGIEFTLGGNVFSPTLGYAPWSSFAEASLFFSLLAPGVYTFTAD